MAVATVAVLAGLAGLIGAIGKSKGLSFGSVFFKRTTIVQDKKTMLPAWDVCTIRTSTGGTIKVPCRKTQTK